MQRQPILAAEILIHLHTHMNSQQRSPGQSRVSSIAMQACRIMMGLKKRATPGLPFAQLRSFQPEPKH